MISGLYAVTPDCVDTPPLLEQAAAALAGGASILQYRNKTADRALRIEQAGALMALCRARCATFIVNDDVELAARLDADGVHLGTHDSTVAAARALLGDDRIIGVSCYDDLARARNAAADGADYVAFGGFFPSPTKPAAACATPDLLRRARRQLTLPLVAIGGIDLHNAHSVIAAGADAIAVISALFAAADVEGAAREFCNLFTPENHDFA
ncbi:MAG TPA: thiamine phosphate synthase [Burkholderiales bacterium]|nr:thiamine phosphate synthase [Burkholderiales bacterium]